jgi:outer membrane protein TolC
LVVRQKTLLKLHQVTTAVVGLRTLESQREAIAAARRRMASTRQRVGKEVELGRAPGITSKYVESELARLGADEASLAGQVAQAQAELAEVTGREQFVPQERDVRVPPWQVASGTLPQRLAEAELRGAQVQFEEAQRELRPSLALGTGVGRGIAHGDHRDTWQVGVTLSMPFSASRAKEADSLALKAQAADVRREAVAREVQRQLAVLRAEYDAANSEAIGLEAEVDYREQVNLVEHEMHKLGNQTLENAFQHERDLLDARYRLSRARARAVTAWSLAQTIAGESSESYISQADGS